MKKYGDLGKSVVCAVQATNGVYATLLCSALFSESSSGCSFSIVAFFFFFSTGVLHWFSEKLCISAFNLYCNNTNDCQRV